MGGRQAALGWWEVTRVLRWDLFFLQEAISLVLKSFD